VFKGKDIKDLKVLKKDEPKEVEPSQPKPNVDDEEEKPVKNDGDLKKEEATNVNEMNNVFSDNSDSQSNPSEEISNSNNSEGYEDAGDKYYNRDDFFDLISSTTTE